MQARFLSVLTAVVLFLSLGVTSPARADLVSLGSGENKAFAVINFDDGYKVQFELFFSEASITGTELLQKIDTLSDKFSIDTIDFGPGLGLFVDGISYTDSTNTLHSNLGYGGGDAWWHYWVRESATDTWTSPETYGSSSRTVVNGSWDGWVYGNARNPLLPDTRGGGGGPTPVPLPAASWMGLAMLGSLALTRWMATRRAARHQAAL